MKVVDRRSFLFLLTSNSCSLSDSHSLLLTLDVLEFFKRVEESLLVWPALMIVDENCFEDG